MDCNRSSVTTIFDFWQNKFEKRNDFKEGGFWRPKIRSGAAGWCAATTLDRPEGILAERTQVKNISLFNARWDHMHRLLALAVSLAFAAPAAAQQYSTQAIHLVAPFGPGGGSDIVGRILAQEAPEPRWMRRPRYSSPLA
jgi:hypothetical protein